MADWSPQQDQALRAVSKWLADPNGPQVFRLFGFAGTGKTTLAIHLAGEVENVLFMAFTGKAALVMRRKGCAMASTIHSAIYELEDEGAGDPIFRLNKNSSVRDVDLVVVDEISMVGQDIGRDLESFGTKILVLGDPFQLPPIKGQGYFTDCEPDIMLTEVHRTAKDNPITRLSIDIREGEGLRFGDYGDTRIIRRDKCLADDIVSADQVLVGLNRTRHQYNGRIRQLKGFAEQSALYPVVGERLICLRNDREKNAFNGSLWNVEKAREHKNTIGLTVRPAEDIEEDPYPRRVRVMKEFFTGQEKDVPWEELRGKQQFTYGYAITVHKSQGSQWDNVFLFDEGFAFREHRDRWLYTGVTRAAEKVTVALR